MLQSDWLHQSPSVAARLLTSKCGKNNKVANEVQLIVSLMFLIHHDFLCDLLLYRLTMQCEFITKYQNVANCDFFYTFVLLKIIGKNLTKMYVSFSLL